jgi:hypothetical protein
VRWSVLFPEGNGLSHTGQYGIRRARSSTKLTLSVSQSFLRVSTSSFVTVTHQDPNQPLLILVILHRMSKSTPQLSDIVRNPILMSTIAQENLQLKYASSGASCEYTMNQVSRWYISFMKSIVAGIATRGKFGLRISRTSHETR